MKSGGNGGVFKFGDQGMKGRIELRNFRQKLLMETSTCDTMRWPETNSVGVQGSKYWDISKDFFTK